MEDKRRKLLLIGIYMIFVALMARMSYFQLFQGEELSKAASSQKFADIVIDKARGNILDRNVISFTERGTSSIVVIKTLMLRGREEDIEEISAVLGLKPAKLRREIDIRKEPIIVETGEEEGRKLVNSRINGVSVIYTRKRYDENSLARHVIGYLNKSDQIGAAGIEAYYENILNSGTDKIVGVVTDATDNPLYGLGYRLMDEEEKGKKLNVKLTLDYHIQKIVEEVMEEHNVSGAVVVEDVNNGDIVAIASKPDFDQNRVDEYLDSPGKELFNKAVASYNLGSVFKIIDAASALESHQYLEDSYFCKGYIEVGDKIVKCGSYDTGGHGKVDITRAFALSCNPYFIELSIRMGPERIIDMARKLGFGSITGIKSQGVDESGGSLPDTGKKYFTHGDTANMAIGQGEVLATPLQVADLVATVANGGIKNKINIVDSIIDEDGNKVSNIKKQEGIRVMSKKTSDIIRSMMEEVVDTGTGAVVRLEEYGGSGGKTGSAETGLSSEKGNVVQAWFAGYFPRVNPKYSVAVFVEDGRAGNKAAAPVFEAIAEEIMKKGY